MIIDRSAVDQEYPVMSLASLVQDALKAFESTTPEDWGRAIKTGLDDAAAGGGTESDIADALKVLLPQYALVITLAQITIAVVPDLVAAGVPADALSAAILSKNLTPYSSADNAPAATKSGEIPMGDD